MENSLEANSIFPKELIDVGASPNYSSTQEDLRLFVGRSNICVNKFGQKLTKIGMHEFTLGSEAQNNFQELTSGYG